MTPKESEQAAVKRREIGPASDVYSFGAILYDLLTGRPPFRADILEGLVTTAAHQRGSGRTRQHEWLAMAQAVAEARVVQDVDPGCYNPQSKLARARPESALQDSVPPALLLVILRTSAAGAGRIAVYRFV